MEGREQNILDLVPRAALGMLDCPGLLSAALSGLSNVNDRALRAGAPLGPAEVEVQFRRWSARQHAAAGDSRAPGN